MLLGLIYTCIAQTPENILLDRKKIKKRYPSEPTIAISRSNPSIIVAGSILDRIYYTADSGITWKKSRLQSPYGVWGDPVIISDTKAFYYFHLSDPDKKNWKSDNILDRIVCQKSIDGKKLEQR